MSNINIENRKADHGQMSWFRLYTNPDNYEKVISFYQKVFNYTLTTVQTNDGKLDMAYNMLGVQGGGHPVGAITDKNAIPKHKYPMEHIFIPFFTVDNVDEIRAKAKELKSMMVTPKVEKPGVVEFATIAEPFATAFSVMTWGDKTNNHKEFEKNGATPGYVGLNMVYADDIDATATYYEKLFGHEKSVGEHNDEHGKAHKFYRLKNKVATTTTLNIVSKTEGLKASQGDHQHNAVIAHFSVSNIDETIERVVKNGGKVVTPKTQFRPTTKTALVQDPFGATIGLIEFSNYL